MKYVGLDMHKSFTTVGMFDPATGELAQLGNVPTTQLALAEALAGIAGPKTVVSGGPKTITYEYDAVSNRQALVDPDGAGDCFDAGFVVGLLEGLPLAEVGRLANACDALGATRKGPMEGAFKREVVEKFMREGRHRSRYCTRAGAALLLPNIHPL